MRERMIPSRSVVPAQRGTTRRVVVVASGGSVVVIGRTAIKPVAASSGPSSGSTAMFSHASKGRSGDD